MTFNCLVLKVTHLLFTCCCWGLVTGSYLNLRTGNVVPWSSCHLMKCKGHLTFPVTVGTIQSQEWVTPLSFVKWLNSIYSLLLSVSKNQASCNIRLWPRHGEHSKGAQGTSVMDGFGEEGRNCLHKSMSNRWGRENEEIKTVRGSGFACGKGCPNSFNFLEKNRKLKVLPWWLTW